MKNKIFFYSKILFVIFFISFLGSVLLFNLIFYLLSLGEYSFEEAKELTKYLLYLCSVMSPLVLLSLIITRKK